MSQGNQPFDGHEDNDPIEPPPERRPRAERSRGVPTIVYVISIVLVGIGCVFVTSMVTGGGKASPASPTSASAEAPKAPPTREAKEAKHEKKANEKKVKEQAEDKEKKREEEANASSEASNNRRQCRDNTFISDCSAVSVAELMECGICVNSECTRTPSAVQLVCSSAVIDQALSVLKSGNGTVDMCSCRAQHAPSASE